MKIALFEIVTTMLLTLFLTFQVNRFANHKRFNLSGFIVTFPFLIACIRRTFSSVYVPDEAWFIIISNTSKQLKNSFVYAPNLEGFGGVFWGLLDVINRIIAIIFPGSLDHGSIRREYLYDFVSTESSFVVAMIALRVIVFSSLIAWFWMLNSRNTGEDSFSKVIPVIVLSFPAMWWSGKIASPELIAGAFAGISGIFFSEKKYNKALLFMSVSVGFKLSGAPLLMFMFLGLILKEGKLRRPSSFLVNVSKLTLSAIFPFLVGNIFLLTNPSDFYNNLERINPKRNYFDLQDTMGNVLQSWTLKPFWLWDYLTGAGFWYWIGSGYLFVLVLLTYVFRLRIVEFAIILSSSVLTGILLSNSGASWAGWYFFPLIFYMVSDFRFPTKSLCKSDQSMNLKSKVLAFLLCCILPLGVINGLHERRQFWDHLTDLHTIKSEQNCIRNTIQENNQRQVFDLAVLGYSSVSGGATSPMFTDYKSGGIYITGKRSIQLFNSSIRESQSTHIALLKSCGVFKVFKVLVKNE